MRNYFSVLVAIVAGLSCFGSSDVMKPEEILGRMRRAADWQLSQPYQFEELRWHNAPFYMGLSDLSEVSGDAKYLDAFNAIGEERSWRLNDRLYHADDHAVGQAYLKLYQRDGDELVIGKVKEAFDKILAEPAPKEYFRTNDAGQNKINFRRWTWCDALYMSPPVWAGLWKVTGEEKYLDFMVAEWKQTAEWLWDEEESLFYRDADYIDQRTKEGKKVFWGRGNGWVFGGLAEILQYLPEGNEHRPYFLDRFRVMAKRLVGLQKGNGTWAPSLLDADHIEQDETSGTAFYVYGLAWGINNGILEETEFGAVVDRGWTALCERQEQDGRLINVQPVGAGPNGFSPDSSVVYGTGAFLSAGSEVYKRARGDSLVTFMEDGGWCWYQDPRAVISKGKLIVAGLSGRNGDVKVAVYDLEQGKNLGTKVLHAEFERDDHDVPALYACPDGSLLAIYARHGWEKAHHYRISDPDDYLKWGEPQVFWHQYDEKRGVTYANLQYMESEGLLYNFFRDGETFNPSFITSSDHGATWGNRTHFIADEVEGVQRPYPRYVSRGSDTVGVTFTEAHPRQFGTSIYYVDFRDGAFWRMDGRKIKDLADGPLLPSNAELVFQGSGIQRTEEVGGSMPRSAWTSSIAVDSNRYPHLGYTFYLSNDDNRFRLARWDGESWIDREVAYAGKCLYERESSYTGLITLDPADPEIVYLSSDVDPSSGVDRGGLHRLYTGRVGANDGIDTIVWQPISFDSSVRNIRPVVVAGEGYKVVMWLKGPWRTFKDYEADVVGFVEKRP